MGLFGFGGDKDGKSLSEGVQKAEQPVSDKVAALVDLKTGQVQFLELAYEGKLDKMAEKLYRLL